MHGCTALTDTLLLPLLKNSPDLWELDLSGCTGLTENIFTYITKYNKQLERLDVSETNFKYIGSIFLGTVISITFLRLNVLVTQNCKQLDEIYLTAPQLTRCTMRGCDKLYKDMEKIKIESQQSCRTDLGKIYIADYLNESRKELIFQLWYHLDVIKKFEEWIEHKLSNDILYKKIENYSYVARQTAKALTTMYFDPIRRIIDPEENILKLTHCALQRIEWAIKNGIVKYKDENNTENSLAYAIDLAGAVRKCKIKHTILLFRVSFAGKNNYLYEEESFARDDSSERTMTAEDIFDKSVPITVDRDGRVTYYEAKDPRSHPIHSRYGFVVLNPVPNNLYKPASEEKYITVKNDPDHQENIALISVRLWEERQYAEQEDGISRTIIAKEPYWGSYWKERGRDKFKEVSKRLAPEYKKELQKSDIEYIECEEGLKLLEKNQSKENMEFIQKIKEKLERKKLISYFKEKGPTFFDGKKTEIEELNQESKLVFDEYYEKLEVIFQAMKNKHTQWLVWMRKIQEQEQFYKLMGTTKREVEAKERFVYYKKTSAEVKELKKQFKELTLTVKSKILDEKIKKTHQEQAKLEQILLVKRKFLSEKKEINDSKDRENNLLRIENNRLQEEGKKIKEKKIVEWIEAKEKLIENREELNQKLAQVESRMALVESSMNSEFEISHKENNEKEKEQSQETSDNISLLRQEYQELTELANKTRESLQQMELNLARIDLNIEEINSEIATLNTSKEEEHETPKKNDEDQEDEKDLTGNLSSPRLN